MSDNKTIDWPADHEEESVGLRAELEKEKEKGKRLLGDNYKLALGYHDFKKEYERLETVYSDIAKSYGETKKENNLLKSDLQYVREENELLKERNAVLLLTMKEYFRTSIDIYSPEAKQAEESAKRLLEKYAAL
jgi:hypothetical protein